MYTACYCEENIWHLCVDERVPDGEKLVLWVGSLQQYSPMWCQRSSAGPDVPVWWDYHVILLVQTHRWFVWDLDTTLPLPVDVDEYLAQTFRLPDDLIFRLMDADYYRKAFSSDRSHMRDSGGRWLASPPVWPAIRTEFEIDRLTFAEMRDFSRHAHGELLDLENLRNRLR